MSTTQRIIQSSNEARDPLHTLVLETTDVDVMLGFTEWCAVIDDVHGTLNRVVA